MSVISNTTHGPRWAFDSCTGSPVFRLKQGALYALSAYTLDVQFTFLKARTMDTKKLTKEDSKTTAKNPAPPSKRKAVKAKVSLFPKKKFSVNAVQTVSGGNPKISSKRDIGFAGSSTLSNFYRMYHFVVKLSS